MNIVRRILLSLVFASGLQAVPTSATPISAGTTTFNLNFTSSMPYAEVDSLLNAPAVGLDAGETITFRQCSDFDGGGSCTTIAFVGPNSGFSAGIGNGAAGFLDGLFSVQLILNMGTVDIGLLTTRVLNAAGATIASQTLIPSAVAEPATLALLGLGLAGLATLRRRKSR